MDTHMNFTKATVVMAIFFTLIGCGEKRLDMGIDSDSVVEVMQGMTQQEQIAFLSDMDLIIALRGGDPYKLNGYTASKVKEEAKIARRFVHEKNLEFLSPLVREMEAQGKYSVRLHIDKAGIFSSPQPGYREKTYTLDFLKSRLGENAGLQSNIDISANSVGAGTPQETISTLEKKNESTTRSTQSTSVQLMGDGVDSTSNAEPNTEEDAANKSENKTWQDKDGFIHYPDGSISNGPVD